MASDKSEFDEFDWIKVRTDLNSIEPEGVKEKMIRKIKENPFVPLGCLVTFGALSYGLWCFRIGEKKKSQYMMRLRVGAQGFTILALVIGIGMTAVKK